MSKIIASAAIRGAHKIVGQADQKWQQAMDKLGANEPVGFPNTAYYLPVIYGILGEKVEKLGDMEPILKKCKALLPPPVREEHPLPYLAPALDAGMVTFFAEELIEAIRYLEEPIATSGSVPPMMSSSEKEVLSLWMVLLPVLQPCLVRHRPTK